MSDLDQRMRYWAIMQLASWDIEPAPENVERLLDTFLAARQRLYLDRRRDKVLRREGWIK